MWQGGSSRIPYCFRCIFVYAGGRVPQQQRRRVCRKGERARGGGVLMVACTLPFKAYGPWKARKGRESEGRWRTHGVSCTLPFNVYIAHGKKNSTLASSWCLYIPASIQLCCYIEITPESAGLVLVPSYSARPPVPPRSRYRIYLANKKHEPGSLQEKTGVCHDFRSSKSRS